MRILITGTNGYIGKSLAKAFSSKYEVTTLTREDCDLTDLIDVAYYFITKVEDKYDVVIHCAAVGGNRLKVDDLNVINSNLQMYYNLAKYKGRLYDKLITFGSGAEIYDIESPYGLSKKIIADNILQEDNFYNLRIYGVFDENELDRRFIKANILRYINKENIEIYDDKFMDFFYMQDLIKLVDHYITEKDLPKVTECRYETSYQLSQIATMINDLGEDKVGVNVKNYFGGAYIGTMLPPQLDYVGIEQGIKNVYNVLK